MKCALHGERVETRMTISPIARVERKRKSERGQIIFVTSHSNDLRDVRCALDIFVPCARYESPIT